MPKRGEAFFGFVCPYRDRCPQMQGFSTRWIFSEYQRSKNREHEHWRIREEMAQEITNLYRTLSEQAALIDQLRAENTRLHQRGFKARRPRTRSSSPCSSAPASEHIPPCAKKKRGAPHGHPPWTRKRPEHIDRTLHIEQPSTCPHCQQPTDPSRTDTTSYLQEDIVLRPQTIVTNFVHTSAYCPTCRRQVIGELDAQLPFAPIGPNAKAAALYLRHQIKLPYRKIQQLMHTLFGLDVVPASLLGFEKRARKNADPLYDELVLKTRAAHLVHADETYWRQDGENCFIWYAGSEDTCVFHIDAHRSSE